MAPLNSISNSHQRVWYLILLPIGNPYLPLRQYILRLVPCRMLICLLSLVLLMDKMVSLPLLPQARTWAKSSSKAINL